jgi:hypothetical protein
MRQDAQRGLALDAKAALGLGAYFHLFLPDQSLHLQA